MAYDRMHWSAYTHPMSHTTHTHEYTHTRIHTQCPHTNKNTYTTHNFTCHTHAHTISHDTHTHAHEYTHNFHTHTQTHTQHTTSHVAPVQWLERLQQLLWQARTRTHTQCPHTHTHTHTHTHIHNTHFHMSHLCSGWNACSSCYGKHGAKRSMLILPGLKVSFCCMTFLLPSALDNCWVQCVTLELRFMKWRKVMTLISLLLPVNNPPPSHDANVIEPSYPPRHIMSRVGQNRIYTPYMTVYLVISAPKMPYVNRIYMVLAWPILIISHLSHCQVEPVVEKEKREEKKNDAGSKTLPTSIKEKETHWPEVPWVSPTKGERKLVGICWRVAGSPLLQTQTLRAVRFFKCAL